MELRICQFCNDAIENEFQFVLICNTLSVLRERYISKKFYSNQNIHKFNVLMSTRSEHTINNLAMYAYYAFKERNCILNEAS